MGERKMEVDFSYLHLLADTAVSVLEGELSLPGELPRKFWDKVLEMRGQDVKLVLEKRLHASDVKPRLGRLSIPLRQIQAEFLTNEEIRTLDNKEGITVSLIEPCLRVRHGLQLKKWNNNSDHFSYVLTKEWTAVAQSIEQNRLRKDCLVQLWSFRANGDLCFCLVNIEAPPAAVENMANHE